ncbi:MAG: right-handed parallel beta-helix repeat-containing protein, partial [Acidobacteria bacterium]|nr:right-handed parallel beta-helix repeat-containing protein [Acidobacteriota bacterium]
NDTSTATTLSIGAGASLAFPSGSGLTIGLPTGEKGTLICNGSAGSPIVMDSTSQTAGSWTGLELYSSSGASSLSYTTITHAGQSSNRSVLIDNASPLMSNLTVSSASGIGTYITGGAPSITNTLFQNLTSYPISLDIASAATLASNTFSGCNPDAIQLRGGILTADRRITSGGGAYDIDGTLEVHAPSLVTLAIDPAVTLRFSSGSKLVVGSATEPGALVAVGTTESPIVFTRQGETGSWGGIEINDGSDDLTTRLAFARVEYAGTGVQITSASPLIEDSRITSSSTAITASNSSLRLTRTTVDANTSLGISASGTGTLTLNTCTLSGNPNGITSSASLTLTGTTIASNTYAGLTLSGGQSTMTGCSISSNRDGVVIQSGALLMTGTAFTSNSNYPITLYGDAAIEGSSALSFAANGYDAILFAGGSMSTSRTLLGTLGVPYHAGGSLYLYGTQAVPTVLSIEPGCTVEFKSGAGISVNQYCALHSLGTGASPVVLRAFNSTTPGAWPGVTLTGAVDPAGMLLSHLRIEYAVNGLSFNSVGAIPVNDTEITACSTAGISLSASTGLSFQNLTITDSTGKGINSASSSFSLGSSSILRSGTYGVYSSGGTVTVTNSTIDTAQRGAYAIASTMSLTGTTISNTTVVPLSIDTASSLDPASTLTLTGNVLTLIEHRGGQTSADHRVPNVGFPYAVRSRVITSATLILDQGVRMQFDSSSGLDGRTLQAIGTLTAPILLTANTASPTPGYWEYVHAGISGTGTPSDLKYVTIEYGGRISYASLEISRGGSAKNCEVRYGGGYGVVLSDASRLENCTISSNASAGVLLNWTSVEGAGHVLSGCAINGNGWNGIIIYEGGNQITETRITDNAGVGVAIHDNGAEPPNIIHSCTITGNAQGGMTYSVYAKNQDARYNYWGHASGPSGVGRGSGDSVGSAYVVFEPWLETAPNPDFEIAEGWASNRIVASRETQAYFWAGSSTQADWTFEIRDSTDAVKYSAVWTGKHFVHLWLGLDLQGQPLAAGYYTWRIEAARSDDPEIIAAAFAGTIEVKSGIPVAEIHTPSEANSLATGLDVTGTIDVSPSTWVLYGGEGEGWVPMTSSLTQLASGTTAIIDGTLAWVDLPAEPPGRHVYVLRVTNYAGITEQRITVNWGLLNVAPNPFSPNGDDVDDTVGFAGTFDASSWTLSISDQSGATVRTFSGTTGSVDAVWDGRNESGELLGDERYEFSLPLYQGQTQEQEIVGSVVLLNTPTAVELSSPTDGLIVSNVLGSDAVTVRGSITIPFTTGYTWIVEVGSGENPSSWTRLAEGQASGSLSDITFTTWQPDLVSYANGTYQLRLRAELPFDDPASDTATLQLGNFEVEITNPSKIFNPKIGETGNVRIHVGFASEVTVDVYRVADSTRAEQPALARRLINGQSYGAGSYDLAWDGLEDAGSFAPDYIYAIQVTVAQDGAPIGSVGDTRRAFYDVEGGGAVEIPTIEPVGTLFPFEQSGFVFTYEVTKPALLTVWMSDDGYAGTKHNLLETEMHVPGIYRLSWDGTLGDEVFTGANFVDNRCNLTVEDGPTNYNNLIGLHGAVPRVESISIDHATFTPIDFGDAQPWATLYYTLDQPADVTFELTAFASGEVIDTWTIPGQSTGAQEFSWNGTRQDGRLVDQGDYRWRITATANGYASRSGYALMRMLH